MKYFVVLNLIFHRKDGNFFSWLEIFLYLTHTYLPLTHIKERDAGTLPLYGYIIIVLDPKAKYLEMLKILGFPYTGKLLNVYKRCWTRIAECQLSAVFPNTGHYETTYKLFNPTVQWNTFDVLKEPSALCLKLANLCNINLLRTQVHTKFHCRQAHAPGTDTSSLTFSYNGTVLASRGGKWPHYLLYIVLGTSCWIHRAKFGASHGDGEREQRHFCPALRKLTPSSICPFAWG